jgi:hypothetical protein
MLTIASQDIGEAWARARSFNDFSRFPSRLRLTGTGEHTNAEHQRLKLSQLFGLRRPYTPGLSAFQSMDRARRSTMLPARFGLRTGRGAYVRSAHRLAPHRGFPALPSAVLSLGLAARSLNVAAEGADCLFHWTAPFRSRRFNGDLFPS